MAVHIRADKKVKYLAPLLKLISDEHIPCVERMWKCEGKCFDPLHPERMLTLHYTWELPAGNEWFVCSKCGAQIHFDSPEDREIDLLDPYQQKIARKNYREYRKELDKRVKRAVKANRDSHKKKSGVTKDE